MQPQNLDLLFGIVKYHVDPHMLSDYRFVFGFIKPVEKNGTHHSIERNCSDDR